MEDLKGILKGNQGKGSVSMKELAHLTGFPQGMICKELLLECSGSDSIDLEVLRDAMLRYLQVEMGDLAYFS